MLHLHKRLPLGSFFRLIEDGGEKLAPAIKLLQVYAREQDREMLRDFYYSDDRRVESAVLALDEASKATVIVLVFTSLCGLIHHQDQAAKLASVKTAHKFFSEDKDSNFEAKVRRVISNLLGYELIISLE